MPQVRANGIEIEYEDTGAGEPLVLIMGIGAQLVHWPEGMVRALAGAGFRVIRLDNRDAGLSSKIDHGGVPRPWPTLVRSLLARPAEAPYTLLDMADDVAGLLDALELDSAHVLGASLGGMVAQSMAIAHPARVKTLTSVMSTTGNWWVALPRPAALRALLDKAPRNEEEAVAAMVKFRRICGSKGLYLDEEMHADIARQAWRRGYYPRGFLRQLAAVAATGDRTHALRFVRIPTTVIHGSDDPLIPPSGGRATAKAIPGAKLRIIEGMGHDLPSEAWTIIADELTELADRARTVPRPASPTRSTATA